MGFFCCCLLSAGGYPTAIQRIAQSASCVFSPSYSQRLSFSTFMFLSRIQILKTSLPAWRARFPKTTQTTRLTCSEMLAMEVDPLRLLAVQ
jgi:hypothetical protein